jgi:hypothetical protein
MRAVLLAKATAATFPGFRAMISANHGSHRSGFLTTAAWRITTPVGAGAIHPICMADEVLDAEISAMSDDNSRSSAAITAGCFDQIEYFLGAGLAAVQKYMSEIICSSDEDQLKALALRSSVYDA